MTTNVALVDYDSGNLHSARKAFEKMAKDATGVVVTVTDDADVVGKADKIVLPGDGAFPACRAALSAKTGLGDAIEEAVTKRAVPFLGICVGMQMLATRGFEFEETPGFDWIGGDIQRIAPADPALPVPHMGWNDLVIEGDHPVLDGIATGDHAYFVHSWQMEVATPAHRLAYVDYAGPITAIVGRDTIVGTQFHPEKSQETGLRLIANFLNWAP